MERPEKITKLAFYLMDKEPLFYLFIINTDFIKVDKLQYSEYCGVAYKDGRVIMYYTQKFIDLPIRKIYFIIIHEAYHIFKRHLIIHKELEKINQMLLNITEDCIINTEITTSTFNGIKPDVSGLDIYYVPYNYTKKYYKLGKDAYVTPRLFNWFLKEANEDKDQNKINVIKTINRYVKDPDTGKYGIITNYSYSDEVEVAEYDSDVIKSAEDLFNQEKIDRASIKYEKADINKLIPIYNNSSDFSYRQAFDKIFEKHGFSDDHSTLSKNEQQKEETENDIISQKLFAEKLIKQAKEMKVNLTSSNKTAGAESGHSIFSKFEKLLEPEIEWRKVLNKYINRYKSDTSSLDFKKKKSIITYLMNAKSRYGFIFPHYIKEKDKMQRYVFIAIDTSGSCFYDSYDMKRFFTEIDALSEELSFNNSGKIFLLQWDYYITSELMEYQKGDWKNIKIYGGGGTSPKCVFDYIKTTFKPVGRSLIGYAKTKENKYYPIIIPSVKEMPLMIVVTDGMFYSHLKKEDIGYYKDSKNLIFLTREKRYLFEGSKVIEYK